MLKLSPLMLVSSYIYDESTTFFLATTNTETILYSSSAYSGHQQYNSF